MAFTSNSTGNDEIYSINVDGSGLAKLTDHPSSDTSPAWSLTEDLIAFDSNRDGNRELYVISLDGTGLRRITNDIGQDVDPVWQPVE
jgi:Tol biopolymer transport system component